MRDHALVHSCFELLSFIRPSDIVISAISPHHQLSTNNDQLLRTHPGPSRTPRDLFGTQRDLFGTQRDTFGTLKGRL